jgi:hypothetical protein
MEIPKDWKAIDFKEQQDVTLVVGAPGGGMSTFARIL